MATPETYLGTARAEGVQPAPVSGTKSYVALPDDHLSLNQFTIGGTWDIQSQAATAVNGATIAAHVQAKDVYLVLSPGRHRQRSVLVAVDGKPADPIDVTSQRLYTVASFAANGQHTISLRLPRARRRSRSRSADTPCTGT